MGYCRRGTLLQHSELRTTSRQPFETSAESTAAGSSSSPATQASCPAGQMRGVRLAIDVSWCRDRPNAKRGEASWYSSRASTEPSLRHHLVHAHSSARDSQHAGDRLIVAAGVVRHWAHVIAI